MSQWELTRQRFPTKYELNEPELNHLPYTIKEAFATNIRGERILFAKFGSEAIYSKGVGHSWRYEDGRDTVEESHLRASFVDYGLVDNLDYQSGTAEFQGKKIKYDKDNHCWIYLNNCMVNFHTSEHNTLAEEEDTAHVEELLETTEQTLVAATQKLSLGRASCPPTPQTGSFSGQTRPTTVLPGSFPANTPKGKAKAPTTGTTAEPSSSTSNLPTAPA